MKIPAGLDLTANVGGKAAKRPGDYRRALAQWAQQLAACKLCRNLTLAAFLAILLIETIILIPSYRNYEEDLLRQHESVARQALALFFATRTEPVTASALAAVLASSKIAGLELRSDGAWLRAGEPVGVAGNADGRLRDVPRPTDNRLDLAWSSGIGPNKSPVRARIDITGVSHELVAFVFRILGLSLLIAVFVTIVTMAVVDRMMLSPLLRLRGRIVGAGADAEHPLAYVEPSEHNNEFGEVEDAFNDMLTQNASYLKRLHSMNQRLDQLLMERTRSLRKTEHELEIRSLYDQLTGLANRSLFEENLTRQLEEQGGRQSVGPALMVLGLDDFQALNGLAGHDIGDRVLQEIARRLSRFGREPGYVARLGGDVFGLVLSGARRDEGVELERDISAIIQACVEPIRVAGIEYECELSAGVAVAPLDGSDARSLLSHAEIAMHRAKQSSGQSVQFFASDLGEQVHRRQNLIKDLRKAVQGRQFELHYQPQFDRLRRCVGYEALLRWRHPVEGLVSPAEFVPLAEETGLILPIGLWVIEEAVRTMKQWVENGFEGRMAVNISARQLADTSLAEEVASILSAHNLDAGCLELEVTETALMKDVTSAMTVLEEFRTLGVQLAVDDFGTGYSSLAYLKALPVRRIKIDRAFVTGLPENEQDVVLCRTIISMAHSLDCEVIAEGVETEAQADWLVMSGCDEVQGFLLGRPSPEGYRPSRPTAG